MSDVQDPPEGAPIRVPAHLLERGRGHVSVHTARWAGDPTAPVQVCVHGLGGSHLNWSLIGPLLARQGTVWAPDLPGFGHSAPQGRKPSVEAAVDVLHGFIRTVSPDRPVLLLGNSMGGLLVCTLAGRQPDLVAGLVLVGPAVPPVTGWPDRRVVARFVLTSTPGVGQARLARRERWLTPAEQVREAIEVSTAAPDDLDDRYMGPLLRLVAQRRRMPHARSALIGATRSLLWRIGPGRRRLWADVARITAPTLVLQGAGDRLVEEPAVRGFAQRNANWEYRKYDDLGHLVMLEDPVRVAADIAAWRRVAVDGGGHDRAPASA